jgi:hypothetical protein
LANVFIEEKTFFITDTLHEGVQQGAEAHASHVHFFISFICDIQKINFK